MGDRRPSLFSRFLASTAPPARRAPAPQTNTSSPTTQTTTKPRAPSTNTTTVSNVDPKTPSRRPNTTKTNPSLPTTKTKARMVDQSLTNAPTPTSPPTIESTKSPSLTENITRPRAPATQPSVDAQSTIGSITSMNPPNVEPGSPTRRSNASPRNPYTPTTSPNPKRPTVDQPITDASISGYTNSALPKDEPRNVLPSRAKGQSRSPPSPPTSSNGATQTPSTPLKASPLHSPSRVASAPKSLSRESLTNSRSTKGTESPSPSKEPRRLAREISNSHRSPVEKGANSAVQEIFKAKNSETNVQNEVKKGNGFLAPNPSYSKSDQTSINEKEALETKEILSTSLLNKKPNNPTDSGAPKKEGHISSDTPDHMALQKSIKNKLSTFANRMAIADSPNDDRSPSVITLAGENRGAVMQIGSNSSQREGLVHINRGYKLNSEVTSEVDKDSYEGKGIKDAEDQPAEAAYVNNNAQAMNNSIVLSSSISERDPGVHIVITKEIVGPGDGATPIETRKVLNTTTSANKLVKHEPMVRRRCLRGMLLESSDSDPEKQERHGCRVGHKEGGL